MKRLQVNNIQIRICDSPEKILSLCMYKRKFSEVADRKIRYYDASDKRWKTLMGREFLARIKVTGSWGFTHNNKIIYIWCDGKPDTKELALLLAHEYGHTKKPYLEYGIHEERKAYSYERCSKFVEKAMKKLGYVWKRK